MFLNLRTNLFFCCCCITTQDPEGVSPKKHMCDNVLIVSDDFRAYKKKTWKLGTSWDLVVLSPLFSNSPAQFLPSPAQKRPRNDLLWPVRPGTGRVASHRGGRPGRLGFVTPQGPHDLRENRPKDLRPGGGGKGEKIASALGKWLKWSNSMEIVE